MEWSKSSAVDRLNTSENISFVTKSEKRIDSHQVPTLFDSNPNVCAK